MTILAPKLLPIARFGINWATRPHSLTSYFSRRHLQEFPDLKLNNKLHQDYVLVLPEPLKDQVESNEALRLPKIGEPEIDFSKINVETLYRALSQTVCTFEDFLTDVNNVDPNPNKSVKEFFSDIEQHLMPMDSVYNLLTALMTLDPKLYQHREISELIERYYECREKRHVGNFKDVVQNYIYRDYEKLPGIDKKMFQIYHPANPSRVDSRNIDDATYVQYKKHLRDETLRFRYNLAQANQLFSHTVDDPDILAAVTSELDQVSNLHHKERTPLKVDIGTYQKFMRTCPDRFIRQMLWQTRNKRCSPKALPKFNNLGVISNIRVCRRKIADILGYRTHVESKLVDCLAPSRQRILENLKSLNEENSAIVADRLQELNDYAADNSFEDADRSGICEYDLDYWTHKYMYEIMIGRTEQELKTFFPFKVVHRGLQAFFKNYFDIELRIQAQEDNKLWSSDVQSIGVYKKDQFIGTIIHDPYHREAKSITENFYARIRVKGGDSKVSPCRLICTSYNIDQATKQAYLSVSDIANLFYCYGMVIQRLLYNYGYYELNMYGCLEKEAANLLPNLCVAYLLTDYKIIQSCSNRGGSKPIDAELASRTLKAFTHFKSLTTRHELYMAHLDLEAHTVLTDIKSLVDDIFPQYNPFPNEADNYDYCSMEEIFVGPNDGSKFADIWSKQLANFCLTQAQHQSDNGEDMNKIKSFNVKLLESLFESGNLDTSEKVQSLIGRSFESSKPTLGVL